jgi:tetratricopeptide (TPR) repeat protein
LTVTAILDEIPDWHSTEPFMNTTKSGSSRSLDRINEKARQLRPQEVAAHPFHSTRIWLLALGLLLATLSAYYPALHGGLLWDDDFHVTRPALRSWHGLYRIWFEAGATLQYYPVLHSAFWITHKLWGDATLWYHLLNILLHAAAALMVALILHRLSIPGAYLAAAIFALHPIQVESVAWISELKNTLSTVFYLGAVMLYLRFDETRKKTYYAGLLGTFLLALLSKTVTGTLPGALLVMVWWRRGRLSLKKNVLPVLPLFVLGAGGGMITARWELQFNNCIGPEFEFTIVERLLIAGRAVWFHLWKLFWPTDLTFIYPRWQINPGEWWQYAFPVGAAALLAALWAIRRWSRAPLAGMLFYFGTLFPVLGFFNLYTFRYTFVANHYQYLASVGIITVVSAGTSLLFNRFGHRRTGYVLCGLLLATLWALAWRQSHQYADAETLYYTTLSRNPSCWLAHNNLGNLLINQGRFREARESFEEALRLKPNLASAYNGMGIACVGEGELQNGIQNYRRAIELQPDYAEAFNNLGVALARGHQYSEAIENYRKSLKIDADYAMAHYNLANALARLKKPAEAEQHYLQALRIVPEMAFANYYLGLILLSQGKQSEAADRLKAAFRLKPDFPQGHYEVGNIQLQQGRFEEAIASYEEALAIKPDYAEAHCNLGTALGQKGQLKEAIWHYREALRIRPAYAIAANNLGRALEQSGNIEEAIALYSEALRMDPDNATTRKNLEQALQSRQMMKR